MSFFEEGTIVRSHHADYLNLLAPLPGSNAIVVVNVVATTEREKAYNYDAH